MQVTEGIKWVGVCTNNFDETVSFFSKTMELDIVQEGIPVIDTQFARYCVLGSAGDVMFEIFEPKDEIKDRYTGPVVSFTVDDLNKACDKMAEQVKFITDVISDNKTWCWRYFQAPDGNIYQVQQRL